METDTYWRELAAKDDGPSALARWACRLNAVALVAELASAAARDVPPSAAATSALTVAAVAAFLAVVALAYAISAAMGAVPGFTPDDYRLSAAMDFAPATEIATVGVALALDTLVFAEWRRPAPSRGARVALGALTAQALVTVAATPWHARRGAHALSTLAFVLLLTAYLSVLLAAVPPTLSAAAAEGAYALGAAVGACVLYLGFGLSVWLAQGRFAHVSAAEILLIALFSALELVMGCNISPRS